MKHQWRRKRIALFIAQSHSNDVARFGEAQGHRQANGTENQTRVVVGRATTKANWSWAMIRT
ncbi:hypothetical protein BCR44DRAFT_1447858 [Catenaria anguillulae PL171]|uniref:Uncharacterized protein n=1 Tax=Catenaria anguillulae PL171 TaxID=765915 RepID=A0A1Y2H5E4_9FUNG|nr:hypothetical protein BCR44DRAFT_1447858 [Catenaria anguillulae PL171]